MSADNGIYIVEFLDGFRVIHTNAIQNLTYFPSDSDLAEEMFKLYFKDTEVFKTEDEAWMEARQLYDEAFSADFYIEYGIQKLKKINYRFDK